jgi:sRNA-binding carbon storage regulator CsrA
MLHVHTQKGQTVYIGDHTQILLDHFDEYCINFTLITNASSPDEVITTHTISAGEVAPIADNVSVCFMGTTNDGHACATLGFEAPRHIKIKGIWQKESKDSTKANKDKLSKMTDASLIFYTSMNAETALEWEMLDRLKKLTKVIFE